MSDVLTLHEKLMDIQQRLKVGKEQFNSFADFSYRKIEDIEEGVKPFLKEHKLVLLFSDEPVVVGERVYIKATAQLSDGKDKIETYGYAREAVTPKAKTDDAQLTGACSSYARKYAAGGLFLIDNTKDADSQDNSKTTKKVAAESTKKQELYDAFLKNGVKTFTDQKLFINSVLGKESIDSPADADKVLEELKKG